MRVYRAIPARMAFEDERLMQTACTVIVSDSSPVNTGLVDSRGVPIYQIEQSDPAGFIPLRSEQ